ncbi:MAG: cache domain-containing protein [Betaproteobacteria bacterium]
MRLKTRVLVIVSASLLGLLVMSLFGLYSMRQGMMEERRSQITQLLDFADSQTRYFYALETSGKMTRDEAQARAKEAIGAQKQGNNYFFIRHLTDDTFILHPIASRVGKADNGGILPDGRSVAQTNRDALAKSSDNKAFIELTALKPGTQDQKLYPKLNGLIKFEPWGWMTGIGFYLDDIDNRFWKQSQIFLVVGGLLFALMALLVFRMRTSILSQLGGEPQDAADCMRKIANGNLNVEIVLEKGDNTSLMASLNVMQMKLTNLTSAIQENATSLSGQVSTFDEAAKSYSDTKSEEGLADLLRSVKKIGKTVNILEKSIARIKL